MDLFNRLVVTVLALAMVAGGGAVGAVAGQLIPLDRVLLDPVARDFVDYLLDTSLKRNWTLLGGGGVAILGVLLLMLELKPSKRTGPVVLVRKDSIGSVTVSLSGLRRLAEYVISRQQDVDAAAIKVMTKKDGPAFRGVIMVPPGTNTPQLSDDIRSQLGDAVQNHIGKQMTGLDLEFQVSGASRGKKAAG